MLLQVQYGTVETSEDKRGARIENRTYKSRFFFFFLVKGTFHHLKPLYIPQVIAPKRCCRCHICSEKKKAFENKPNSTLKQNAKAGQNVFLCCCGLQPMCPSIPLPLRRQHIPTKFKPTCRRCFSSQTRIKKLFVPQKSPPPLYPPLTAPTHDDLRVSSVCGVIRSNLKGKKLSARKADINMDSPARRLHIFDTHLGRR